MSTRQQLIDHLADLQTAYATAFAQGDWDRADVLGQCISDTRSELAKLV